MPIFTSAAVSLLKHGSSQTRHHRWVKVLFYRQEAPTTTFPSSMNRLHTNLVAARNGAAPITMFHYAENSCSCSNDDWITRTRIATNEQFMHDLPPNPEIVPSLSIPMGGPLVSGPFDLRKFSSTFPLSSFQDLCKLSEAKLAIQSLETTESAMITKLIGTRDVYELALGYPTVRRWLHDREESDITNEIPPRVMRESQTRFKPSIRAVEAAAGGAVGGVVGRVWDCRKFLFSDENFSLERHAWV